MKPKIALVMIAYKAAPFLEDFYRTLQTDLFDNVILVDDASNDGTYELAKGLGIDSYKNTTNLGYGGNLKRALSIALEKGADVIVDIHPDGEYLPSAIIPALQKINAGAELVLGNRFYGGKNPVENGMHAWKYVPIIVLNWLARTVLGVPCHDVHQGFRVYTRKLLATVPYQKNSNDYLFSFEIIAQAAFAGMTLVEVPVDTRYSGNKRGASLKSSIRYTLGVLKVLVKFLLARLGMKGNLFSRHI